MPCRPDSRFPNGSRQVGIDLAIEGRNSLPAFSVIDCKRPATKKVVLPRRGATGAIDPLQGDEKLGQGDCKLAPVDYLLHSRSFAFDPPVDRPWPRITA